MEAPNPLDGLSPAEIKAIYARRQDHELPAFLELLRSRRKSCRPIPLSTLARAVVGPTYIPRPHTDYLIRKLEEAVSRADDGQDTNLIVSMPPGMGKSMTTSVVFPLWLALHRPEWEIGIVSAEASLAEKFSGDVRRLYDERKPGTAEGGVKAWTVGGKGGIVARGISGALVGRRLRVAVIDDPIRHMEDAYSETVRRRIWNMWQGVIKTRMRPGSIVLSIATRWHDDDLNGRLLKEDGWEHVVFPALAEHGDQLGRKPGEPLLSVQKHETAAQAVARYEKTRQEVGSVVFNAQYQQRPGDPQGTVFLMNWFRYVPWDEIPEPDELITSWDLTFGTKVKNSGDWNVGAAMQRTGNRYFVLDIVRFRGGFTKQLSVMRPFLRKYPDAIKHVVERAANGQAVVETLQRTFNGVVDRPVGRTGKPVRASAVSPLFEAGQVSFVSGAPWCDQAATELSAFPTGAHDDVVDALSQGLSELKKSDAPPVEVRRRRGRSFPR
jgi:predicted phage terminase large subunit-like protein